MKPAILDAKTVAGGGDPDRANETGPPQASHTLRQVQAPLSAVSGTHQSAPCVGVEPAHATGLGFFFEKMPSMLDVGIRTLVIIVVGTASTGICIMRRPSLLHISTEVVEDSQKHGLRRAARLHRSFGNILSSNPKS